MHGSQRGQCAQCKQERVPRQNRCYYQAGFAKYHKKYDDISPYTKALDDHRKILVEVDKEIYEIEDYVHTCVLLIPHGKTLKFRNTLYRVNGESVNMKKIVFVLFTFKSSKP